MDDDGAAEEILKRVDAAPQLEEELRLLGNAVVGPAHELNVGHFSLRVLLPLLERPKETSERCLSVEQFF